MGSTMKMSGDRARVAKLSRWRRITSQFGRDRKGVAAIEMALVTAPFLALLFAILETGIVFFSEFALEQKVADASRLIRTGQVDESNTDHATFKSTVCSGISVLYDCDKLVVDVRSFSDFEDMKTTGLPEPLDGNTLQPLSNWSTGDQTEVVVVRVFYEWNLLLPSAITHMDNLGDGKRLIAASVAFRNEPFDMTTVVADGG